MSATLDFLGDAVSNTYEETVDFWTSGNVIDQTVDAVKFTVENPKLMLDTAVNEIEKDYNDFGKAVKKDTYTMLFTVGLAAAVYYVVVKGDK